MEKGGVVEQQVGLHGSEQKTGALDSRDIVSISG